MSKLFLKTLRDDPADAEVASHRLLVRAGYIRRVAPGGFSWLPLGWDVFRNVENMVRDEMNAAGFQEVHFPALLPREPYEATGRWTEYGDNLFRLQDRKGADFLLAPTHEEMFTLMVKDIAGSYKDLPVSLYQIQTKYRDEARPRAGLLRTREFVMKDSYSFDLTDEGLDASYAEHRASYIKLFERMGLPYVIVSAMSGAMGGSKSEEFLAPMEVGEDTYIRCTSCDYAANVEAVTTPVPDAVPLDGLPAAVVHDTPDTPTIDTLVDFVNADEALRHPDRDRTAADTLKNLVVNLKHPDGTVEPLAIGVPGDRDVDMKRLEAVVSPAEAEPFAEEDFAKYPALAKGYIGPGALGSRQRIGNPIPRRPADRHRDRVDHRRGLVRQPRDQPHRRPRLHPRRGDRGRRDPRGRHVSGVWCRRRDRSGHRDRPHLPTRTEVRRSPRSVGPGRGRQADHADDGVVRCGRFTVRRSDRRGDVRRDRPVLAPRDRTRRRTRRHGGQGRWPTARGGRATRRRSRGAGLRVLFDDRMKVSPGVRFKDAELIGVPTIAVAGRGIEGDEPTVEVKDRRSGDRVDVALADVVDHLVDVCTS